MFLYSQAYFKNSEEFEPEMSGFRSIRGRVACLISLFVKVVMLPCALLEKICKTLLYLIGIASGALLVLLTLGISETVRDFFIRRAMDFAGDLADWILLPLALLTCLVRHFLACTIHPAIHFRSIP